MDSAYWNLRFEMLGEAFAQQVLKASSIDETSDEKKAQWAMEMKEIGNSLYRKKDFVCGALVYETIADVIVPDIPNDHGRSAKFAKLVISCYLNLAACYLQLEEFSQVISLCSHVVLLDNTSAKSHYRRAQAYEKMGNLRAALIDYEQAHKLEPQDKLILTDLENLTGKMIMKGKDKVFMSTPLMEPITSKEYDLLDANTKPIRLDGSSTRVNVDISKNSPLANTNDRIEGEKKRKVGTGSTLVSTVTKVRVASSANEDNYTTKKESVGDNFSYVSVPSMEEKENKKQGFSTKVFNVSSSTTIMEDDRKKMCQDFPQANECQFKGDSIMEDTSCEAQQTTEKHLYKYVNCRKANSVLHFPKAALERLEQGHEIMYYNPSSLAIMRVRPSPSKTQILMETPAGFSSREAMVSAVSDDSFSMDTQSPVEANHHISLVNPHMSEGISFGDCQHGSPLFTRKSMRRYHKIMRQSTSRRSPHQYSPKVRSTLVSSRYNTARWKPVHHQSFLKKTIKRKANIVFPIKDCGCSRRKFARVFKDNVHFRSSTSSSYRVSMFVMFSDYVDYRLLRL